MKRIKLIAKEGMLLTNGESYGRVVFLGSGDSPDHWHMISQAEYDSKEVTENV